MAVSIGVSREELCVQGACVSRGVYTPTQLHARIHPLSKCMLGYTHPCPIAISMGVSREELCVQGVCVQGVCVQGACVSRGVYTPTQLHARIHPLSKCMLGYTHPCPISISMGVSRGELCVQGVCVQGACVSRGVYTPTQLHARIHPLSKCMLGYTHPCPISCLDRHPQPNCMLGFSDLINDIKISRSEDFYFGWLRTFLVLCLEGCNFW